MRSYNGGIPSATTTIRFAGCNSEVIFRNILFAPGLHHLRLAVSFRYPLLSSSSFFYIYIAIIS